MFMLQTGHIFVFTGLLRLTGDGSQLAVILGHEMAHAFLSHSVSREQPLQVINVYVNVTV